MSVELDTTREAIDTAIRRLHYLRTHVAALEAMAYERRAEHNGPKQEHRGGECGDVNARREWVLLRAWLGLAPSNRIRDALHPLTAVAVGIEKVLNDADESPKIKDVPTHDK
jgi:hypothetical protein